MTELADATATREVVADELGGLEVEAIVEHGEPLERFALWVGEQADTPLDVAQGAVSCSVHLAAHRSTWTVDGRGVGRAHQP